MTRALIYSMSVSLDGFVAGPGGEIDWSVPDEEQMRFHVLQTREIAACLCGRGCTRRCWSGRPPSRPGPARSRSGSPGYGSPYRKWCSRPHFPPLENRLDLKLLETRTFGSDVVGLRYRRIPRGDRPGQ